MKRAKAVKYANTVGGWETVIDKPGNRLPRAVSMSCVPKCGRDMCLRRRGAFTLRVLLLLCLLLLLLLRPVVPLVSRSFLIFLFFPCSSAAVRLRVAASASDFSLPTSLSATWLVWQVSFPKGSSCCFSEFRSCSQEPVVLEHSRSACPASLDLLSLPLRAGFCRDFALREPLCRGVGKHAVGSAGGKPFVRRESSNCCADSSSARGSSLSCSCKALITNF